MTDKAGGGEGRGSLLMGIHDQARVQLEEKEIHYTKKTFDCMAVLLLYYNKNTKYFLGEVNEKKVV